MQNATDARIGLATTVKVGLTAAVMFGAMGFLVYSSTTEAQHYKMVDELVGEGLEGWRGKALKVHGWVATGTIVQAVVSQEMRQTFVLEKAGKRIRVFARGPMPDTFRDGAEVVASGRLVAPGPLQPMVELMCAGHVVGCPVRTDAEQAWVLDATEVSAKCVSHYSRADANRVKRDPLFK
jgi:cytochrome c-type biogenesis protein CcmE